MPWAEWFWDGSELNRRCKFELIDLYQEEGEGNARTPGNGVLPKRDDGFPIYIIPPLKKL